MLFPAYDNTYIHTVVVMVYLCTKLFNIFFLDHSKVSLVNNFLRKYTITTTTTTYTKGKLPRRGEN